MSSIFIYDRTNEKAPHFRLSLFLPKNDHPSPAPGQIIRASQIHPEMRENRWEGKLSSLSFNSFNRQKI
jgi:hypothetical protein